MQRNGQRIVTSITSNAAANAGNFICDITVTALTRRSRRSTSAATDRFRFDAVAGADRVASDIASKQLNRAQDIKAHVTLGNAADSGCANARLKRSKRGLIMRYLDRLPLLLAGIAHAQPCSTRRQPDPQRQPAGLRQPRAERRLVGHAIARRRDEERRPGLRYWCVEAATGRLVTVSREPCRLGNVGGRLRTVMGAADPPEELSADRAVAHDRAAAHRTRRWRPSP